MRVCGSDPGGRASWLRAGTCVEWRSSEREDDSVCALRTAARVLVDGHAQHVHWEPADRLNGRVASLTPALALARVDGSSPVEYLSAAQRAALRSVSRSLVAAPPASVSDLVDRWATLTEPRKVSVQ